MRKEPGSPDAAMSMTPKKKNGKRKTIGFLPFLPVLLALPGAVATVLGLILPFADLVTKNPYTSKVEHDPMTLSAWGKRHEAALVVGDGYAFFEVMRGFAWALAIAAPLLLLLLLWNRFDRRSVELRWTVAGGGALIALASVLFFIFAFLFSVKAAVPDVGTRVFLLTAPYCSLAGGILSGIVSFFAVRRDL